MDQSASSKKMSGETEQVASKGMTSQFAPHARQRRGRSMLLSLLIAFVVLCTSLSVSALNPTKTAHAVSARVSSASDTQACSQVYSYVFLSDMANPTLRFDYTPGGGQPATQYALLINCGQATTAWISPIQVGDGGQWLTISQDHGILDAGGTALIAFDVNPSVVPTSSGIYISTVTFYTNAAPITVTVLFYVGS